MNVAPTLDQVVQFLLGAGELESVYFGDIPKKEQSPLWWRKHLRAAYTATQDTGFLEIRRIKTAVANYYQIDEQALANEGRTKNIAEARQMAYLLCRALTPCSTTEIGAAFARDHTTVVKGMEQVRKRINSQSIVREQYEDIKVMLEKKG